MSNSAIIITGSFTLGAVVLTAGIDAGRRRHDERLRERDARNRAILDVVTAAGLLHDAVRLFREVTQFRRGIPSGIATGFDFGGKYTAADPSMNLPEMLIAGLRDVFKLGGIADQGQSYAGARYQEIVTPPLQRLTAAAASVQMEQPEPLKTAAQKLMQAASNMADEAQSRNREYGRAESRFKRAQQDFQAAASKERRK